MVRLLLAAVFLAAAPAWSQEVKLLEDTQADSAQPQAAAPGDMPQIIVPSEEKPAETAAVKPVEPEKKPEAVKKTKTPAKKSRKAPKAPAAKPAVPVAAAPAAAAPAPAAEVKKPDVKPAAPEVKPVPAPAVKPVPAAAVKTAEKPAVPAAETKKPETKSAAPDMDSLPELTDVSPADVKPAAAVEPAAKPTVKAEAPKPAAPKAAPAPAPKAEPKPEVKTIPAAAAAPAPKAAPKPEVKAAVKPLPAEAPKAAPKPEAKAVPPAAPVQPAKPADGAGFAVQKTHTVTGGDTLWDLSSKYYQDPYKWGKIYNANLGVVSNPDRIYPKSELVIPDITEEVKPEVRKPAAIAESETVKEASMVSADVAQPAPALEPVEEKLPPAPPVKTAAAELSEALDAYDRNDLSEEMPEHQREWAAGVKVVPGSWREDGVITARAAGDEESMEDSLSLGGDVMQISMSGSAAVKKGDYLNVYLKGSPAYDKAGKKIGLEIQRAGLLEVTSVDGSRVKARVIDSVTAIAKGFVVKKK